MDRIWAIVLKERFARAQVEIIRQHVSGWAIFDRRLFISRQFALQLRNNSLRQTAFYIEQIVQLSIVLLRPSCNSCAGIDQLRIYSNTVACLLDTAFQHVRNTESLPYFAFIFLFPAVSRHAAAADYL